VLSSILSTAVRWQVIPFNPCDRVQPPRQEHKEALYLDEKQAAALLTLLARESLPHRTMITLLLFTGLRRGELCGLEWKDIDFERLLLSVRRTSLYLPNRGIFTDETKNSSSRRVISLSASVVVLLREYQAWQEQTRAAAPAPWPDTDRLFTKADGTPIHPNTLSRWFTQFIARTDLPPIHIHSLRHTNATLQIAGGVPITTVADRLGHATPGTTSRIYAHAVQSANAAAAELLDQMLLPGNAPHPTSGENAGSGAPTCERRPDGNSLKNNK
jgi:integrase